MIRVACKGTPHTKIQVNEKVMEIVHTQNQRDSPLVINVAISAAVELQNPEILGTNAHLFKIKETQIPTGNSLLTVEQLPELLKNMGMFQHQCYLKARTSGGEFVFSQPFIIRGEVISPYLSDPPSLSLGVVQANGGH